VHFFAVLRTPCASQKKGFITVFEDEDPKPWEIRDEEPPETLRRKWEQEETTGPKTVLCPSCHKETPAENLICIFCHAVTLPEVCPVSGFLNWVKRLFKGKES